MKNVVMLILWIFVIACSSTQHSYTSEQIKIFQEEFDKYVEEKNEYFKNEESLMLDKDKINFSGLHYYDYNPNFRFEGPIITYKNPDTVIIYGSKKEDERPSLKFGYFEFTFDEKVYQLQIYKILRTDPKYQDYLFLGFTDETSNQETYGGGRYIDLQIKPDNHYIIDFNYAYNPYCAYNPRYSCAIPTRDNHLKLAIEAGEKKWHD